jgi:hypothetical protein
MFEASKAHNRIASALYLPLGHTCAADPGTFIRWIRRCTPGLLV